MHLLFQHASYIHTLSFIYQIKPNRTCVYYLYNIIYIDVRCRSQFFVLLLENIPNSLIGFLLPLGTFSTQVSECIPENTIHELVCTM